MTVARRSLIAGGTAGVGLVVAGAVPSLAEASPSQPAAAAPLHPNVRPFPPLMDDPQGLLALPPGFRYTVVTEAGETHLTTAARPRRTTTAPRCSRPSGTACT